MEINRYLSPYGGGECGPPSNPPCQGPDCPGTGCEPWCDELCPDGSWPPCDDGPPGPCPEPPCPGNVCTGTCCDGGVCICDDCSYDEDGDWHVYWSCKAQAEVIMRDNIFGNIFASHNNHFNVSQTNLQQEIEIGDNFCGTPCHDDTLPGTAAYYPNDCYTYLGKKHGSTPATTVAGGLTHATGGGYWAGFGWQVGAYYDLSVADCGNCGEDPEPPSESGCMDPVACNYDPLATGISVNCCYEEGCTDPLALNYELGACCDDGSCCYVSGCTDSSACNYDEVACVDDGSCCYIAGCRDAMALNYNHEACCTDNNACCYTLGCTDPTATNYDPLACFDDGSCAYCASSEVNSCETNGMTNMNQFWTGPEAEDNHLQWFMNPTNYQIPFGNKYFEVDEDICKSRGSGGGGGGKDNLRSEGENGGGGGDIGENNCPGPNNGDYISITSYECYFGANSQIVYSWQEALTFFNNYSANLNENHSWVMVQEILNGLGSSWGIDIYDFECCECTGGSTCGCTDPTATNYDPIATFDDGSCTYCNPGCTDEAWMECNYSATYTCDCNGDPIGTFAEGWDSCCNCEVAQPEGCMDIFATNYDPTSTANGNCSSTLYCLYEGCIDPAALNYCSPCNVDDGSCTYPIEAITTVFQDSGQYQALLTPPTISISGSTVTLTITPSSYMINIANNSQLPGGSIFSIRWSDPNLPLLCRGSFDAGWATPATAVVDAVTYQHVYTFDIPTSANPGYYQAWNGSTVDIIVSTATHISYQMIGSVDVGILVYSVNI